jgi:8-oxo-dGTP diphosphatase
VHKPQSDIRTIEPGFVTEVAVGIVIDEVARVLLIQRLPGKPLAGLWEFPGGKLEPGESVAEALARELGEELGIEVGTATPLISIPWTYAGNTVRVNALRVTEWRGVPEPRVGHRMRWAAVRDLDLATMPAADTAIVAALRLPVFYVIKPESIQPGRGWRCERAVTAQTGRTSDHVQPALAPLVQLRLSGASHDAMRAAVRLWTRQDPAVHGRLLLNHDIALARELGVGVHLKAAQLRALCERPLPADSWVGASCHDAQELELAAQLRADFATLSPVCATASHPNAKPLGWQRFARLVADAQLPVYGLGGVGPGDLARARAAGAQGVAGIRAFA